MTFSFFTTETSDNNDTFSLNLSALSTFIRTKANANTLYKQGEKGGDIEFSPLETNAYRKIGHFSTVKPAHLEILSTTLKTYQLKLKQLQTMDFTLGISFALGLAAFTLSPLLLGVGPLVSIAAFSYFGYQLKAREAIQSEYKKAQNNMTTVYIWAMNDTKSTLTANGKALPEQGAGMSDETYAARIQDILHRDVKAMHAVFNPMLSDNDIWAYTRSDLDSAITTNRDVLNKEAIENESTSKLQLSLTYLLYGQDQGSSTQVAKGLFTMTGQIAMSVLTNLKDTILSVTGSNEADLAETAQSAYKATMKR